MKLKHDKLLSNFAFNCNLRHYNTVIGTVDINLSSVYLEAEGCLLHFTLVRHFLGASL